MLQTVTGMLITMVNGMTMVVKSAVMHTVNVIVLTRLTLPVSIHMMKNMLKRMQWTRILKLNLLMRTIRTICWILMLW